MNECSLGVHEIELVIDSREDLSNGSGVGDHADGSHDLGKITTWHDSGWLIVDAALEASWAPVDELDGSLGLDGGDGGIDILGDDITSVHEAAGHVFAVTRIALGHHGSRLESRVGNFRDGELLVVGLLGRDDWCIRGQHEVNTWVRHQVSLELSNIDVECAVESERGSQRGDDLREESVQVGVSWSLNVEVSAADIIYCLIVEHDSDIGVFEERVSREYRVVRLNNGSGDLWGWVDSEAELGFLAVVNGQSLKEERAESRASASTDSVEDEEALETCALISELSDSVKAEIDNLFTDGVVATSEVVGGIFFSGDELLRVEELSVSASPDFVNDSRLKIEEDAAGYVLAGTSL